MSIRLAPDCILNDFRATSKKQALEALGDRLAIAQGLDPKAVFDGLMTRERLGSTGVGQGIAIPHARCAGLDHMAGLFARLHTPIDFESVDGQPVDLIFMLLAPEHAGASHLQALARIARFLRSQETTAELRTQEHVHNALAPFIAREIAAA